MTEAQAVLSEALRRAPRRYRMPALPERAEAAEAAGADTALAFAIEGVRGAVAAGQPPPQALRPVFERALAALVREALEGPRADPAFQALVLRAQEPVVDEHVRLAAHLAAHRRRVQGAVTAIAHPGKLRVRPPGALREALARLHGLAVAEDWAGLQQQAGQLLAAPEADDFHPALEEVMQLPALAALLRHDSLQALDAVRQYTALCSQRGPNAGSAAAAAQGRASARAGEEAEQRTARALEAIASLLNARTLPAAQCRAWRSLRVPAGFPGPAAKAKEEWDAALVCAPPPAGARGAIVLLAEVKAAPAAATADFARLLRGLQRLAAADAAADYTFVAEAGEVRLAGASLRALQPQGLALPPHVIYACAAGPEGRVQVLSAATRGVLLAEPASVAYALALRAGQAPQEALSPVWLALPSAARLRSALHQFQTAQTVRAAMLHPDDLLAAVHAVLA